MVLMPIEHDKLLHEFGSRARETGGYVDSTAVMDEDMLVRRIWEAIEKHNKEKKK